MKPSMTLQPTTLLFMRHGATQPNLDGVRCGGDMDVSLTDTGRRQIELSALILQSLPEPIDLIVCSDLKRTLESATILSNAMGHSPVQIIPTFRERMLGSWNLKPLAETEHALRSGATPPGGESIAAFKARIDSALHALVAVIGRRRVLLVGSKGVARVLSELAAPSPLTLPHHQVGGRTAELRVNTSARNGELLCFDLTHRMHADACLEGQEA